MAFLGESLFDMVPECYHSTEETIVSYGIIKKHQFLIDGTIHQQMEIIQFCWPKVEGVL